LNVGGERSTLGVAWTPDGTLAFRLWSAAVNHRVAPIVSVLSVGCYLVWVGLSSRAVDRTREGAVEAVEVPPDIPISQPGCPPPVAWRVVDPDPRFGVERATVEAAVRVAVGLWELGAGRTLFVNDPEVGVPVRSFV